MPQRSTDLLSLLAASLPPGTFALLKTIAFRASQIDMPLYLVGGSVRDMLLGAEIKDLDLVTEGDASVLAFEVSKEMSGEVVSYSAFGTATVKVDTARFDLATARQETYLRPGALPSVTPSSMLEDLGRRDFSINSIAVSLSGSEAGTLLDPCQGNDDLERGLVRVLHPNSFLDDPTRILRAIRYEQRLGFQLGGETQTLLLEALASGAMQTVSGDRIRRELELMFEEKRPDLALSRCGELRVLQAIYPPLENGPCVKKLAGHLSENPGLACLSALSYPLSPQAGDGFIRKLSMPSRWASAVRDTIAVRMKSGGDPSTHPHIGDQELASGDLCTFLDQRDPTSIRVHSLLTNSPCVRKMLELYLQDLRHMRSILNGRDIIKLGLGPGPQVGEVLRELKRARIDGAVHNREEEMNLVRKYIETKGPGAVDRG